MPGPLSHADNCVADAAAHTFGKREGSGEFEETFDVDEVGSDHRLRELGVFLAASNHLRHDQIVRVETHRTTAAYVTERESDQAATPAVRKGGRLWTDTLSVHAEQLLELGELTDGTVNQITLVAVGIVDEHDVCLD